MILTWSVTAIDGKLLYSAPLQYDIVKIRILPTARDALTVFLPENFRLADIKILIISFYYVILESLNQLKRPNIEYNLFYNIILGLIQV